MQNKYQKYLRLLLLNPFGLLLKKKKEKILVLFQMLLLSQPDPQKDNSLDKIALQQSSNDYSHRPKQMNFVMQS